MYQALANILDSYSENGKLLDQKALEKIIEISIEHKNKLGLYIKDFIIAPKEKARTFATYNIEDKIIKFYLEYCYEVLSKRYRSLTTRQKNEILMHTLLHEIRHANQNLVAFNSGNNLEQAIIRASILIQTNESYYLKNSRICPLERLAEIDSLLQMILIVRKSKINNEVYYFNKIDDILHFGYPRMFNESPTEKYIKNAAIDYFSISKNALLEIRRLYSIEQRLRLGVRVNKREFKKELKLKETLKILRK